MSLRPTKHEWAMGMAEAARGRADCIRSQVGAVIIDRNGRVASTGYNGSPSGRPGCLSAGACPRSRSDSEPGSDYANCVAVHAECNAIIYGDYERMLGSTIYTTRKPCSWCRKLIQGAGITRVVFPDGEGQLITELA